MSSIEPAPGRHVAALRWIRRAVILVTGVTVLLVGVAMIVLPGPALLVIPLGFAILAAEFAWARRLLKKVRDHLRSHGVDLTPKSPRLRRLLARLGLDDPEAPPPVPPSDGGRPTG